MKVKIKKLHPDAVIPSYAKAGDAGMDLTAVERLDADDYGVVAFKTGLAVEIPEGHVGLVFPRSSIYKSTGRLSNSVGVIDSGYRGEIIVKFDLSLVSYVEGMSVEVQLDTEPYKKGDRVAQLIIMPIPQVEFEEVEGLTSTERGDGGFGSTDMISLWSEGYAVTGDRSGAMHLGVYKAKSIKEAALMLFDATDSNLSIVDEDNVSYWGCRLFDNEGDARQSFG